MIKKSNISEGEPLPSQQANPLGSNHHDGVLATNYGKTNAPCRREANLSVLLRPQAFELRSIIPTRRRPKGRWILRVSS